MAEGLKKVGNYKLVKKIGQGATSEVFEGRKQGQIERYAIKMIKIKGLSAQQKEMIQKQVIFIKNINHPNIVKLYQTLQTPNNYYLVFQFCQKGDLEKYLKENVDNLLHPDYVKKIIRCIAYALQHLHQKGIAHRDIKLPNILLKKDFTIKLADLGFAKEVNNEVMMKTYCGTPITMAPEILQYKPYDKKCDIWSLGVILFQLIYGKFPFSISQGLLDFIHRVINQKVVIPSQPPMPSSFKNLIYGCLEKDKQRRFSIEQFLSSEWMSQMGQMDSTQISIRESVTEVLKKVSKQVIRNCEEVSNSNQISNNNQLIIEEQLSQRVHDIICRQLEKIIIRHVELRSQLLKLVINQKQLEKTLYYYDYEILYKLKTKNIRLRMEGEKDVEINVSSLKKVVIPEPLFQDLPQACQAGVVLTNYLKKLAAIQEFDLQKKKSRYEIVVKFMDFIQNFDLEVILIVNHGFQTDISLQNIGKNINQIRSAPYQNKWSYCPTLNHITIGLQCKQKDEKFREYANALKINCQKRIDSIQKQINGY